MKKEILIELEKIEKEYDVKVLYACEAGSRAWKISSPASDYDVRFIYLHKPEWYLSIDGRRDVIELPISERLDIHGWDLTKALRLYRKSNPSLMEWLSSGIVYDQAYSIIDSMKSMIDNVFMPKVALYHYLNTAKGNYHDCLHNKKIRIKTYFYVLRSILACKWIETYHSVPPLEFPLLLDKAKIHLLLKKDIRVLMERREKGDKFCTEKKLARVNHFVETEMAHLTKYASTMDTMIEDPTEVLNQIFRDGLKEVWER